MGGSSSKAQPQSQSQSRSQLKLASDFDKSKHFQISPGGMPGVCMTYTPSGVKILECKDTPEQYWGLRSSDAIHQAAIESNGAGSKIAVEPQPQQPQSTLLVEPKVIPLAVAPTANEPFTGYITHKGFGFHVKFIDILFFLLLGYILVRFLN